MKCKNCGAKNPDWVYKCIKCNKVVFKKELAEVEKGKNHFYPVKSPQNEKKKLMSKDIEAIFALSKLICREAIEPLNQLFRKNNPLFIRENAAKALGQIKNNFVILPLVLALKQIKNDKKIAEAEHEKNEPSYTWHPGDEYSPDQFYWAKFEMEWEGFENSIIKSICNNINKETLEFILQQYKKRNITKSVISKILTGIGQPAVEDLLNDIDKSNQNLAKYILSKIKSDPNTNRI